MCRYCKKLLEINDLREKNLKDCIKKWKHRDLLARELILFMYANFNDKLAKVFGQQVHDFLTSDWIGD